MAIRWRLTLWFALILAVILILSGFMLHFLLQRYLIADIDDSLRVYTARVHGTLDPQEIPAPVDYEIVHSKLPPVNEFAFPGIYIELLDQQGNVVVRSNSLGDQQLPVEMALFQKGLSGNAGVQTVAAGGSDRVRIMASPLYLKDQTLLLEVAQSLHHVDATMDQVKLAIMSSVLLALTLASVSGGMIVKSALSPVARMTQIVRSIQASSDLSRQVGYEGPSDEIGQLAATFDLMIANLHKLFQSQKRFVADASHELRGPLTVISGNVDVMKRDLSEEDRRESLRAIQAETQRMTRIVNDLLTLAELESGQLNRQETVALKEILLEEFKRTQPLAGNRRLSIGRQDDIRVGGDSSRLKQLLANLVDNAIKYTPEDGAVTLSLFVESEWACLQVADTGIGIAPEHLPHIFERFYRADKARSRATGGTGLGLAIVKEIAEQHSGRVTVASEPGKGSTFTAWLKL